MVRLLEGSSVRVRVPGSSANIGPGFDSIGLALGIWDECVATVTAEPGLVIEVEGEGAADVPRDDRHLVHRSMVRAWEQLRVKPPAGLHLSCRNAIPHGRGLGSSASAIVAGIVAAQGLCDMATGRDSADNTFDRAFTNNLATAIEGHPDNASASVFGGMTLSWADDVDSGQIHSVQLEVTADVIPLLFIPATQLPTATARAVLPELIPHCVAAQNSARVGLLVEAVTRRPELLLAATREWLHQEQRRSSFPDSMALLDTLRGKGHAAVISGAGPSVLVLTTPPQIEEARALADHSVWRVLAPGMPLMGASLERVST
ncbi:MAG: homoserine kinase [Phycicoccus sp.]|nr:homoserine kinase [Phycicoccus sp.]NMM34910.1 homoserine kinase [Phycicoccus sp.]